MTTLRASSRPDLTQRSYADYFRGSGRPSALTPSRSNPSIYHQPAPQNPIIPIPVPFPRVPFEETTPIVQTYDREPGLHRSRKQSWHSTADPLPLPSFQRGSIPIYNPNPELKQAFSHSPTSSRTHISSLTTSPGRPKIPPPNRPEPSRSLVDLYSQQQNHPQHSSRIIYEPGSALETSM
uniref:Uncharacterized protein n=1 Tax=Panagrolaimus superbus TaxID=310955 RepID=A0A914Z863_9BILA